MHFRDKAIIVDKYLLNENSYIITTITENHGIYAGVVKIPKHKTCSDLEKSNLVDFFWKARMEEHLGTVTIELIKSYSASLMHSKSKLYAFNALASLVKACFYERQPHPVLFKAISDFLAGMKYGFSIARYIQLELIILAQAGYLLTLDKCGVSGVKDDLCYVSPRSGKAISAEIGAPYAEKLLTLPNYVTHIASNLYNLSTQDHQLTLTEIRDSFKLTSYFFQRYLFHNKPLPKERQDLISHLENEML
jgi:DNA repair protein RecO (recombination protein O)